MPFLHGIEVQEIDTGPRPIRTVRSAVIGIVGTAPDADAATFPLDKPVLIAGSKRKAGKLDTTGNGNGSLPAAVETILDQAGAMVVVVRVEQGADEDATQANVIGGVSSGQYTGVHALAAAQTELDLTPRILLAPHWTHQRVQDGITDINVDSGGSNYSPHPQVSISGDGNGAEAHAEVATDGTITGIKIDDPGSGYTGTPTVSITDPGGSGATAVAHVKDGVIQSIEVTDQGDGNYSHNTSVTVTDNTNTPTAGTFSVTVQDGYVTAVTVEDGGSGYSDDISVSFSDSGGSGASASATTGIVRNAVVAEMLGLADRMRAIILADGPDTNDADAIAYRNDFGSRRVFPLDPWALKSGGDTFQSVPQSPVWAGVMARVDQDQGFHVSPSNEPVYGIVGTTRPVDWKFGDTASRANYLNEHEVNTIIRQQGFRTWGNRTASSDPKWAFINVVRTNDIIAESLVRAHLWAVDRNITTTYFEDVTEGVNDYLRTLEARGWIAGGRCWADPELNTPSEFAKGRVYFNYEFSPYYPAEHIQFRAMLTRDYLQEIVPDQEAA